MNQVTNKERREVAKKLREEQSACIGTFEVQEIGAQCVNLVRSIDRCIDNGKKYWLCTRLADLIEPDEERTGTIKISHTGDRDKDCMGTTFLYTCCGYSHWEPDCEPYYEYLDSNFCPHCGARMVD